MKLAHPKRRDRWILPLALLGLLLLTLPAPGRADTLILKDGTEISGKILSKSEFVVVIQVGTGELQIERTFPMQDIREIRADPAATAPPAPNPTPGSSPTTPLQSGPTSTDNAVPNPAASPAPGSTGSPTTPVTFVPIKRPPTYAVIPMHGQVGMEIDKDTLEKCLQAAKAAKVDVIVMEINSPGGTVSELRKLIDLMVLWQSNETIPVVAYVQDGAYSAAAVLAMSIKSVYMQPGSVMGAALQITAGPGGVRAVGGSRVGEKFDSAFRGKARTGCEAAGHNPQIVEGMTNPDVELSLGKDLEHKPVLLVGKPADFTADKDKFSVPPRIFKPVSKLLTLTPAEALDCGASAGTVKNYEELGTILGKPGWKLNDEAVRGVLKKHLDEVAANNKTFDMLVKQIGDTSSRLRRQPHTLAAEGNFQAILNMITRLETLATQYPYIAGRVQTEVPDLEQMKADCETVLGEIRTIKARGGR